MSDTGFAELMVAACGLSVAWLLLWLIGMVVYSGLLANHGGTWTRSRLIPLALLASLLGNGLIVAVALRPVYHEIRPLYQRVSRTFGPLNDGVAIGLECLQLFCIGMLVVLLIGMAVSRYSRWAAPRLSASEMMEQNPAGKLSASRVYLACGVGLIACGWIGFGYEAMWLMLGLTAASLIGDPLIATLWRPATASAATSGGDLTPDRQRVLRLLEEGKINAGECSELMGAMAQTMPTAMAIEPMTGPRRALLAGAVVVLVAFFLPWFTINLAQEAQRLMGSMAYGLGGNTTPFFQQSAGGAPEFNIGGNFQSHTSTSAAFRRGNVTMSGGDMQHGLGWLMLVLAAMVPAMHYVVPTLPASTRRTAMFLALAAGSVMGLYLLTSGWRWAEYGLLLALAGFAVQWAAAIRESRAQQTGRDAVQRADCAA